jgi:hypothetical protein
MKSTILFLLFLFASGCDEQLSQPGSSDPYQLWLSRNIHDYTVEQVRSCFCIEGGQRMRLTVRQDTILQVLRLSDSTILSLEKAQWYRPVGALFAIIKNNTTDSLVIRYNAENGYPEFLDINPQQHPYDGGVLIETSNLKPL